MKSLAFTYSTIINSSFQLRITFLLTKAFSYGTSLLLCVCVCVCVCVLVLPTSLQTD